MSAPYFVAFQVAEALPVQVGLGKAAIFSHVTPPLVESLFLYRAIKVLRATRALRKAWALYS